MGIEDDDMPPSSRAAGSPELTPLPDRFSGFDFASASQDALVTNGYDFESTCGFDFASGTPTPALPIHGFDTSFFGTLDSPTFGRGPDDFGHAPGVSFDSGAPYVASLDASNADETPTGRYRVTACRLCGKSINYYTNSVLCRYIHLSGSPAFPLEHIGPWHLCLLA
jgi:hypothetical protein